MVRLGNNEVLKTFTKTLTFVDANADAGGSTIALRERCSGELKIDIQPLTLMSPFYIKTVYMLVKTKKKKKKKNNQKNTCFWYNIIKVRKCSQIIERVR